LLKIRLDKFVWCVRLCKTRSQGTELISKGQIKLNSQTTKPSKEVKFKETILAKPLKNELEIVNNFLKFNDDSYLFKQNEFVRLFPKEYQKDLQVIASYLYIKKAGVELGVVKGKDMIPSHELAMSSIDISHLPYFDLNKEQSLQYLGKKEVNIDINSKGWALVKFEGVILGRIKALQNRINNYYPIEWRILKENLNK
jgi:NOL1/NOP2/fmu family ribosome biogenesis protein